MTRPDGETAGVQAVAQAAAADRAKHATEMRLYVRLLASVLAVVVVLLLLTAFLVRLAISEADDATAQGRQNERLILELQAQTAQDEQLAAEQRRTAQSAVQQVIAESRRLDQQDQAELERLLNEVLAAITAEVRDPRNNAGRPTPTVGATSGPRPTPTGSSSSAPRPTARPAPTSTSSASPSPSSTPLLCTLPVPFVCQGPS